MSGDYSAMLVGEEVVRTSPPATDVFAFNGDADGLCALQQLRLHEDIDGMLVTGTKRDIRLLSRVVAGPDTRVTVLDISHDQNRKDVERLLREGVLIRYFDHHFAGAVTLHPRFDVHIDTAPDICTSALVNGYLHGRHVRWAIVGAFGDEMPMLGKSLARAYGLADDMCGPFAALGNFLNYNAYGETVDDLHFTPAALAESMRPFADPFEFIRATGIVATLRDAYEDDMARARALRPERDVPGAWVIRLPCDAWARRAIGMFANELVRRRPDHALAVLSQKTGGGYVVSVRVPDDRIVGADDFCRMFATGGGRKRAAGINDLPEVEVEQFVARFETTFRQSR